MIIDIKPGDDYLVLAKQQLNQAGDFILFRSKVTELTPQPLHLIYFQEVIFDHSTQVLRKAQDDERFASKYIRAEDFKQFFDSDLAKLEQWIANYLIELVGIDFDGTLTRFDTDSKKAQTLKPIDNRLFPQASSATINALLKIPRVRIIIATQNYSCIVQEYFEEWQLVKLPIFSLNDIDSKTHFTKRTCFQNACQQYLSTAKDILDIQEIMETNKVIGIVKVVLIDNDDEDEEDFIEAGIEFIKASSKNTTHLKDLNERYHLNLAIDELEPPIPSPTTRVTTHLRRLSFSRIEDKNTPSSFVDAHSGLSPKRKTPEKSDKNANESAITGTEPLTKPKVMTNLTNRFNRF